jgi:hypothetical protein
MNVFSFLNRHAFAAILVACLCLGSGAIAQEPDREAKVVNVPAFVMPADAEPAGIDGTLKIAISLDAAGTVKDVRIMAGPAWPCGTNPKTEISNVVEAVKRIIRAGTFMPAIKKGKAVEAELFASFAIGEAYQDILRKREREEAKRAGKPEPKLVKGGVLNGRALKLPKPGYPLEARSLRLGGSVAVQT